MKHKIQSCKIYNPLNRLHNLKLNLFISSFLFEFRDLDFNTEHIDIDKAEIHHPDVTIIQYPESDSGRA